MRFRLHDIKSIYQTVPDEYGRIAFWGTVFVGVPALMMWLASSLSWFWHWFGWFGLSFVALVTITLLMVLMAAYRHYHKRVPNHDSNSAWHASFTDRETASLAGKIQHLGEVVARPGFIVFAEMTTDGQHFLDVMQSTHIIWTNKQALQLRRDFAHQIALIGDANKSRNSEERHEYLGELDTTISSLVKVLLGQSQP